MTTLTARRSTPRVGPDQTKIVAVALLPLLAANTILWKLYAQNGWIAAAWFVAFIACIFYARKS